MGNNQVELHKRLGATWITREVAFNDGGTPIQCFPKEAPMLTVPRAPVPNTDESQVPFERRLTRLGQKSSMGKLTLGFAGDTAIGVVAPTYSAVIPQDQLLWGLLGGRAQGTGGSTVLVGSTSTNVLITVGHSVRFFVGQSAAFPNAAGTGWNVRRIVAVTGGGADALGVYPALPSAPITGGIIHNGTTWYPTWAAPGSVAMRHAQADASVTNFQAQGTGMTGDLSFDLSMGKLISFTTNLHGADGTEFGALGYSTTAASPITTPDFYNLGSLVHFKACSFGTFEHVPVQDIKVTLDLGNYLKGEYGGTNGITGVGRTPKSPMCHVEIKAMADRDMLVSYLAGTTYSLYLIVPDGGSGATQRFAYFDIATMAMPETPDYEALQDDARQGLYKFEATTDSTIVTAPTTDLARAPFRCGIL